MTEELVKFLKARLDEEADLARRCDGDGCGEWSAHGHTVDFCQVDLSGFHPTIARHVALHDPARVLREIEAKRRILAVTPATHGRATTCETLPRPTPATLTFPHGPEAAQPANKVPSEAACRNEPYPR
ncbi:DUF6221 family protein [Streptomyces sp. NPDC086010]|uniref:DUF6221 family protein n=1 Tax=Streptomyces sp. NPDC086010 TaxID=3365745 RepID=UPI0037D8EDE6